MLEGHEGLTLPGSSRGAQPCGCMPAIQDVTPSLGPVLPRTGRAEPAPERCSSQWVPPGLGCLKGSTAAFSISRGLWVYLLWLVSDTTARGSWEAPAAPPALLRPLCCLGKDRSGLQQGRKRPRGPAGNGTACQGHPGETLPASHQCLQHAKRRLGENLIVAARVLPHGLSLQSLGQNLPLYTGPGGPRSRHSSLLRLLQRAGDGDFPATGREGVIWCRRRWLAAGAGGSGVLCAWPLPGNHSWGDRRSDISVAEMQSPVLPGSVHVTAAGTVPLQTPAGLLCQATPFPTAGPGGGTLRVTPGAAAPRAPCGGLARLRGWDVALAVAGGDSGAVTFRREETAARQGRALGHKNTPGAAAAAP